jgi:hypothetical protein
MISGVVLPCSFDMISPKPDKPEPIGTRINADERGFKNWISAHYDGKLVVGYFTDLIIFPKN